MKKNDLKRQVSEAITPVRKRRQKQSPFWNWNKARGHLPTTFWFAAERNPRQVQAIADEVELRLKRADLYPAHTEGYKQAEWVLLDYVDFVVHVFSEQARKFYDLERLWKSAAPHGTRGVENAAVANRAGSRPGLREESGPNLVLCVRRRLVPVAAYVGYETHHRLDWQNQRAGDSVADRGISAATGALC